MREQNWQSLLFVISIVVFGTGIYFYLKNRHARHLSSVPAIEATQNKEATAKEEEKPVGEEHSAAVHEHAHEAAEHRALVRKEEREERAEAHEEALEAKREGEKESQREEIKEEAREATRAKKIKEAKKEKEKEEEEGEKKAALPEKKEESKTPIVAIRPKHESAGPGICQSIGAVESLGEFKMNIGEWNRIIILFHKSKDLLLAHLATVSKDIPAETTELLKNQLKQLKIAPPPWKEEAHLKWQSIGLWVRKETGATAIHVSEEFFRLFAKDPHRAQFEMVRLVAQSWAPCELARLGAAPLWDKLIGCLNLSKESCTDDFYSEGGWAVSSALAVTISPPKCTLPAFSAPEGSACLKSLGLSPVPAEKTEGAK